MVGTELNNLIRGKVIENWAAKIPVFPTDKKGMGTRVSSGKIMQFITEQLPSFMGGSADLNTSTHTELKDKGNFGDASIAHGDMQGSADGGWNFSGRNIQFGVREHAMASISNGMAAHGGIVPFCSTFLIFSDYMRPAIRLAALMKLNVIYVFTHDSIAVGEDGPTHEPVEQLASLRAIPNLTVIRPADANETAVAWQLAIESVDAPVALILTRQSLPTLDRKKYASAAGVRHGAYVLCEADTESPDMLLIATGSEVNLIVEAQQLLRKQNISVRVISMPSWELFEAQTQEYKDSIILPSVKERIIVEAGVSQGWHKYAGESGKIMSVDTFGASAPGDVVQRMFGFTVSAVCEHAMTMLKKNSHDISTQFSNAKYL